MAPSQLVQELADVVAMILDAELSFDQHGNSLSGPQFGPIAMRHGPLCEEDHQFCLLLQRQTWWSARGGLGLQCSAATAAPRIAPSEYTAGVASDAACNLMQREVLSQEGDHAAASILQIFRRTVRSHGGAPFWDGSIILHYLCGGQ